MTITVLDFECMDEETQIAFTEARAKTAATPQLAWSQADVEDYDEYIPDHTTRWLGLYVAILVAVIAGLAAIWMHETRPATSHIHVAAPVVTTPLDVVIPAPPAAAAPTPVSPVRPDQQFLDLMGKAGWDMTAAIPATLIKAAHTICTRLQDGETNAAIAHDLKVGTPEITTGHAIALINNAKSIYCPK